MEMEWAYCVGRHEGNKDFLLLFHRQSFRSRTARGIYAFLARAYGVSTVTHGYLATVNSDEGRYEVQELVAPPYIYEVDHMAWRLGDWRIVCDAVTRSLRVVAQDINIVAPWGATGTLGEAPYSYISLPHVNGFLDYGISEHMPRNVAAHPYDGFHIQLETGEWIVLMLASWSFIDGSCGFVVHRDGSTVMLKREQVNISYIKTYQSKKTGVEYPIEWRLHIGLVGLDVVIQANLEDQELDGHTFFSIRMWYGVALVSGSFAGKSVNGRAYVHSIRKQRFIIRVLGICGDIYYKALWISGH